MSGCLSQLLLAKDAEHTLDWPHTHTHTHTGPAANPPRATCNGASLIDATQMCHCSPILPEPMRRVASTGSRSISLHAATLEQKPSTPGNELPLWYMPPARRYRSGVAGYCSSSSSSNDSLITHSSSIAQRKRLPGSLSDLTVCQCVSLFKVKLSSENAGGFDPAATPP